MSDPAKTATATPAPTALTVAQERQLSFVPLGETAAITLTVGTVKKFLARPTRSGHPPTDADVVRFMMLCQARSLNPWVGDAYLVGYDSKDGPQFNLITAHQALLKRAESCVAYDGMESGVVLLDGKTNELMEFAGDLVPNGMTLIGGWARVFRKDRRVPDYDRINLKTFNSGRSRWADDPAGMIVKCAEASALRKAFPSQIGAMITAPELDVTIERDRAGTLPELPKDVTAAPNRAAAVFQTLTGSDAPVVSAPDAASEVLPKHGSDYWRERITAATTANELADVNAELHAAPATLAVSEFAALEQLCVTRLGELS